MLFSVQTVLDGFHFTVTPWPLCNLLIQKFERQIRSAVDLRTRCPSGFKSPQLHPCFSLPVWRKKSTHDTHIHRQASLSGQLIRNAGETAGKERKERTLKRTLSLGWTLAVLAATQAQLSIVQGLVLIVRLDLSKVDTQLEPCHRSRRSVYPALLRHKSLAHNIDLSNPTSATSPANSKLLARAR